MSEAVLDEKARRSNRKRATQGVVVGLVVSSVVALGIIGGVSNSRSAEKAKTEQEALGEQKKSPEYQVEVDAAMLAISDQASVTLDSNTSVMNLIEGSGDEGITLMPLILLENVRVEVGDNVYTSPALSSVEINGISENFVTGVNADGTIMVQQMGENPLFTDLYGEPITIDDVAQSAIETNVMNNDRGLPMLVRSDTPVMRVAQASN